MRTRVALFESHAQSAEFTHFFSLLTDTIIHNLNTLHRGLVLFLFTVYDDGYDHNLITWHTKELCLMFIHSFVMFFVQ